MTWGRAGSDPEVVCQKIFFESQCFLERIWPFCSPWKTFRERTLCSSYEKQGRNLLSSWYHCRVPFMWPLRGLGIKIDVWEKPLVYASTRDWSCLYCTMRSCSVYLLALRVSLGTLLCVFSVHCRGCCWILRWRQRKIFSHRSLSTLPLHVTKKSVSPHDSEFIQTNVRQPFQVHSSSSGLCAQHIEIEQQVTVGEVSQLLEVMALASRLADPDNVVPSLPGSDSRLSKKKRNQIRSLFLHNWVESSYILNVVGIFWVWSSTNHLDHCCMSGSWPDFVWLCHLCQLLTITVRDKTAAWLVTVMWWKSHRGAGGAPSNSLLMFFEKVSFRATAPAPVIVRATFSCPIYSLFLFYSSGNCLKDLATEFFYSFPTISGDEKKSGHVEKHLFCTRFKIFRKVNLRTLNSVAKFCW